ncbi:hypothetical protein PMAYCL1PPCAC_17027, partial [Pristionchus mayeri]
LQAVAHWGRSQRALDIKRLISKLWPEKKEKTRNFHFDSLKTVEKEMMQLSQWMDFDLITSIDFDGVETMNQGQLETLFGIYPRTNVKKLNLATTSVMPEVWQTLARLFPAVKVVRCSEDAALFPLEVAREAELVMNRKIPAYTLVDQKKLAEAGHLDKERIVTLRCLKRLFPSVQHM